MKVSKLFHWLYASVMFIPLLITVLLGLAVRSDNNFQPIEVTAQENKVVDFNQLIDESIVEEAVGEHDGVTITYNNHHLLVASGETTSGTNIGLTNFTLVPNHIYIYRYLYELSGFNLLAYNGYDVEYIASSGATSNSFRFKLESNYNDNFYLYFNIGSSGVNVSIESIPQVFDLTQMFGSGNEPTLEQFNIWLPNDYYEYTTSKKVLLKDIDTITYNDNDVGSQMVYTLYNATDKYFNFNKFLGIGDLLDWFELNVFNGNAPLGFIIFWNLLIYWLLVSIAWLIFDIAMYVPKLAHRWLDKASLE